MSQTHSVGFTAPSSSSTRTSVSNTGTKHVEFRGLHGRVVGVLNFLQQFAIVVKQAGDAAVDDQFFEDADGQMGLAGSDLANDQQAFVAARVAFLGEAGRDEVASSSDGWAPGKSVS